MEIHVIASGSSGNATYAKINNHHILIDVGISYQKIKQELEKRNIDITLIDTVLLTHEHVDHVSGLKTLLNKNNIKDVYLTAGTLKGLGSIDSDAFKVIKADNPFIIDDIEVMPIMLSHDSNEPVGFIIESDEKKLVYITDTGYIDKSYIELLKDADIYILEANHNPFMLMHSNRHFILKKRILGEKGHLSNADSIWLMNQFVGNKQTIWVAAHISEECNSILEIEKELVKDLKKPELIDVYFATRNGIKGIKI